MLECSLLGSSRLEYSGTRPEQQAQFYVTPEEQLRRLVYCTKLLLSPIDKKEVSEKTKLSASCQPNQKPKEGML
ncbi:unnamed protein product [Ranitomeya imitator]|uniref:Uncharacterized protein n=1 Tax=Ranitomeya imitator TaxID=111125 RepID=A0ABN9LQU1_9NEOB|nr:unnamed protein product [Ranitomeya imitator]